MQILRANEKKRIIEQLNGQFGISGLPYLFLRFGKEKLRIYSGNLSSNELNILDKNLRIESAGLYFAKQQDDGIRLSLDSLSLFKNQINKNILEITNEQAESWFKGQDLLIQSGKTFKILANSGDFIGCGKSTGERITNFMPKERRIKGQTLVRDLNNNKLVSFHDLY